MDSGLGVNSALHEPYMTEGRNLKIIKLYHLLIILINFLINDNY